MSDFEEEELEACDPAEVLPFSLAEIEAMRNMRYMPSQEVETASYLYGHADGTTKTYLRPEFNIHLNTPQAQACSRSYRSTSGTRSYMIRTNMLS
ncbi:hypothetical protein PI124_g17491 [Phytophthora idaei]|nr:hypothetical protein PI125_g18069 [Phytophthora idaei]KAG3138814.1 hypothetical protein PI126_g16743 [Phytophthora idaei]KAG3237524.1 hypothetical protein PI124_g17491 [Phytophthora idaei]